MTDKILLEMKNITKDFSGVRALDNVSFSVKEGEIHALCGENGAGKSTLMKVLSGVYGSSEYEGQIIYESEERNFNSTRDSEDLGIVIIHQELALVQYMTVVDNIFLGNEQGSGFSVDSIKSSVEANKLLDMVGLNIEPETTVEELSVGQQQLVEIAKAFSKNVKLLILDEPTASLNETESENLLNLILRFKKEGVTSILISHKLDEVIKVADSISVLRDGKVADEIEKVDETIERRIVKSMVGREIDNRFPDKDDFIGDILFEIKNWNVKHPIDNTKLALEDINFKVRSGEVVGFAGLMGSGRTELALSIFGNLYGVKSEGEAYLRGKLLDISSPKKAIDNGLAYATEDRKDKGLILIDSVNRNISMSSLEKISQNGIVNEHEEVLHSENYKKRLNIRASSIHQTVESLSGGNQQKVVLSKWLMSEPELLILDEPTRGIDVGAKYEIYTLINDIAKQGKGIILISSDLPELLGVADRIYAIHEGQITGEIQKKSFNEETVMNYMLGINEEEQHERQN